MTAFPTDRLAAQRMAIETSTASTKKRCDHEEEHHDRINHAEPECGLRPRRPIARFCLRLDVGEFACGPGRARDRSCRRGFSRDPAGRVDTLRRQEQHRADHHKGQPTQCHQAVPHETMPLGLPLVFVSNHVLDLLDEAVGIGGNSVAIKQLLRQRVVVIHFDSPSHVAGRALRETDGTAPSPVCSQSSRRSVS